MANTISTSTSSQATSYSPNTLVALAANGDALVIWFDGTNVKYSYAASPYTSWTNTTLVASIGGGPRWQAGLSHNTSDDSVVVVVGNSAGTMLAYVFTHSTGSHSWTPGSANTVLASSGAFNGGSVPMCRDAQGRIWVAWANNSNVIQVRYSSDGGVTWTASTTATQVGGGANNVIGLAYIGNYVVLTYVDSTITYVYQRIDAHSASLGSWSTKADTGSGVDNGANAISLRGAPGSNYGVLLNDEGASIPARYYNAGTDTWSSTTTLGSASDREATLATDGTNLYAIWCKFSASNNYSLVYKKFNPSTQTWDAAATQLQANGTNILWPSGDSSSTVLGYVFTVGTASPYSIKFDSLSLGGGGTQRDIAGTANVAASASLTLKDTKKPSGTASASFGASLALTDTKKLSGTASATASATLTLTDTKKPAGTADARFGATLDLTVVGPVDLSGSADATTTARLALTDAKKPAGSASVSTSASLTLSRTKGLAASGDVRAGGALTLTDGKNLAGSLAVGFSASLNLTVSNPHAGSLVGTLSMDAGFLTSTLTLNAGPLTSELTLNDPPLKGTLL